MQLPLQTFSTLVANAAAAVQGSARQLVDLTIGSTLRAVLEANASLALWMQWLILLVLRTTRAATSTGADLDTWVADFGLARLPRHPGHRPGHLRPLRRPLGRHRARRHHGQDRRRQPDLRSGRRRVQSRLQRRAERFRACRRDRLAHGARHGRRRRVRRQRPVQRHLAHRRRPSRCRRGAERRTPAERGGRGVRRGPARPLRAVLRDPLARDSARRRRRHRQRTAEPDLRPRREHLARRQLPPGLLHRHARRRQRRPHPQA